MENKLTFDFAAFVNAVKDLGILEKKNQATLHHSAVSIQDWAELNDSCSKLSNRDDKNEQLDNIS